MHVGRVRRHAVLTGIIGPGDERQMMFSFIMVNIPYDTEVEYEVAVVASGAGYVRERVVLLDRTLQIL